MNPVLPIVSQIRNRVSRVACGSVLYNWSLAAGGIPEALALRIPDPWQGCPERGRQLCLDVFDMGGEQITLHNHCWEPVGASQDWLDHLHGFEWLRDLRALGGDSGRQQARELIASWIRTYPGWSDYAWRPDLAGARLSTWMSLFDFYGASADSNFQALVFESMIRQARHLSRSLPGTLFGLAKLRAAKGLVWAGLALVERESWAEQGIELFTQELNRQILADGGHISRSPTVLLSILRQAVDLRTALHAAHYPFPPSLQHAIDRMAPAVRFFRCGDRRLSLFNGSRMEDAAFIDSVLAQSGARGRTVRRLPQTGYDRAGQGRALLVVDTGRPPEWPHDATCHAALLSFEFAYGRDRIFTNCGTHPTDSVWRDALRNTSAHNALVLDHRNAVEIRKDGSVSRRPRKIEVTRRDTPDSCLIEAAHDGYAAPFGVTHRRILYLGRQGGDLRGEDALTRPRNRGREAVPAAIRFHLHPRIVVSLIRQGTEALLRLPGGSGWRFHQSGGTLSLEDSVFLGEGGKPCKTKQLVISSVLEEEALTLKWALQKEGG